MFAVRMADAGPLTGAERHPQAKGPPQRTKSDPAAARHALPAKSDLEVSQEQQGKPLPLGRARGSALHRGTLVLHGGAWTRRQRPQWSHSQHGDTAAEEDRHGELPRAMRSAGAQLCKAISSSCSTGNGGRSH